MYIRDQVKLESSTHGSPPPQGKSTHGLKLKSKFLGKFNMCQG